MRVHVAFGRRRELAALQAHRRAEGVDVDHHAAHPFAHGFAGGLGLGAGLMKMIASFDRTNRGLRVDLGHRSLGVLEALDVAQLLRAARFEPGDVALGALQVA